MMEESLELTGQVGQEAPRPLPIDHYQQQMRDKATWQLSRQESWKLYEELYAHHDYVLACYEALVRAIKGGQERQLLWEEFHKAITEHRLLANRYRLVLQQRLHR